ncbi:complement C1q-like protein 2 [Engraulis encrasicolus]|uniref:complement C1q-like protein 2 n=1 Tax=Engraulis encrasicolus TaxID=184585 RepID=UPI002FD700AF
MVVEQRTILKSTQDELQITKAQLNKMETDNNEQDKKLIVMAERLVASETRVEALERVTAAQEKELTAVKTRVAASEAEVMNRVQSTELTTLKIKLLATETEVENLITEMKTAPKVAFSAGLTNSGYVEAGNTDLNLVFSRVITNVGQAYSSITGFFTAPVRGVYYFRFTVMDMLHSRRMIIRMVKNGQALNWQGEYDNDGQNTYLSNGLTLQLEVGDVVNLRIPTGNRLYDNGDNHCTFSGFLLFPL